MRRHVRIRRYRLQVCWSLFHGGTGEILPAGLLFSMVFVAVAVLWLIPLVTLRLLNLKPADGA